MRRFFCLASAILVPAVLGAQRTNSLVGSWRLVSYEQPDSSGHMRPTWGAKPLGLIVYQPDGTMAAHGFDERRPSLQAAIQTAGVEAARAAAFAGLFAYYGSYSIDTVKRQVTHHIEGAWVTDWIGHDVVRSYRFPDRDHVELRVVSNADGKLVANPAVLVWERLKR